MTPARLAALALELLGPVEGPIAVVGPTVLVQSVARVAPAPTDGATGGAIVSFVDVRLDVGARQAQLAALRARLVPGAPLVLVDNNQPRRWLQRLVSAARLVVRGLSPARGRHPAARELQALGFRVERLRLASGERVQLVLARR